MVKIHIIGAGLSGLAAAYFCKKNLPFSVYLYDKGDKKGASFIGAGLVHPFAGPKGLLSQQGFEAFEIAASLIKISKGALIKEASEQGTVCNDIVFSHHLHRVATNGFQRTMFSRWHKRMPHFVRKLDKSVLEQHSYLIPSYPVYEIKCGLSVNMPLYLKGLKIAFENEGGKYVEQWVGGTTCFSKEDIIIYAVGRHLKSFSALNSLDVYFSKGHVLIADTPSAFKNMKPVLGKGYLSMGSSQSIVLGTTYEKTFTTDDPDKDFAIGHILSQMKRFVHLEEALTIREVKAGIRVVNNQYYFPIAKKMANREYVITAMGSRGLLYHAMLGRYIAQLIGSDKDVML